jgi:hypothetical protein
MADDANLRGRLVEAEHDVFELARALDEPVEADEYHLTQLALAARSRSLLRGFIELAEGPAAMAAFALLRPVVEINILMRFLSKSPVLHLALWHAEGDRGVLAMVNDYNGHDFLRERWGHAPLTQEERETLAASVTAARERAHQAGVVGVGKSGSVLPTTVAQLRAINEPGADEAYTLAYRTLGADVHAGSRAFIRGSVERRDNGTAFYSDVVQPADLLPARALALTTFASTLAIASQELALGLEEAVDEVKHRFVPGG